ncbi:hypothetical protein M514_12077 [Trichuris suis]|uniref:vitamin-K-epoxide reductase (warfarin-sensitive) n=1 Tax=Trichuris suis TaxID=68888 RepID=A0A085NDH7_9BILA|nr:hypothetical protein M514_12077 [Trichuris suis]
MSLLQEGLLYKHIYSCLSLAGIIVSVYGFCLEVIKEYDPSYTPLCDVNQQVSCTKAMMSSWGRGFGIVSTLFDEDSVLNQRNPVYGVAFYTLLLIVPIIKEELIATVGFVLDTVLLNILATSVQGEEVIATVNQQSNRQATSS